jgi:hypothetical protein
MPVRIKCKSSLWETSKIGLRKRLLRFNCCKFSTLLKFFPTVQVQHSRLQDSVGNSTDSFPDLHFQVYLRHLLTFVPTAWRRILSCSGHTLDHSLPLCLNVELSTPLQIQITAELRENGIDRTLRIPLLWTIRSTSPPPTVHAQFTTVVKGCPHP